MRDVPSPINLKDPATAAKWAAEVNRRRPYRAVLFQRMAEELRGLSGSGLSLLELGSGPGLLAHALLEAVPVQTYTLLDFSDAMHSLARARLVEARNCIYVTADFSKQGWSADLGTFSAVVTLQAVHELRHKRRAKVLHSVVRELLAPGGLYLVCDHFAGLDGMQDTDLYATIEEQALALSRAGFRSVRLLHRVGSLALHRAVRPAA